MHYLLVSTTARMRRRRIMVLFWRSPLGVAQAQEAHARQVDGATQPGGPEGVGAGGRGVPARPSPLTGRGRMAAAHHAWGETLGACRRRGAAGREGGGGQAAGPARGALGQGRGRAVLMAGEVGMQQLGRWRHYCIYHRAAARGGATAGRGAARVETSLGAGQRGCGGGARVAHLRCASLFFSLALPSPSESDVGSGLRAGRSGLRRPRRGRGCLRGGLGPAVGHRRRLQRLPADVAAVAAVECGRCASDGRAEM
jgi:hypothetical protein